MTDEPKVELLRCPLCGDIDFNALGLALHFHNEWCDVANTLLSEEAQRRAQIEDKE